MNLLDVLSRIVLVVLLGLIGFMAPFWVTVVMALLCIAGVALFVEAIVIVMIIEYIARDFVGFGFVGWLCLLWLLVCESRRGNFRLR